jgi:fibrillarin-like pre-rRNA processing protein
MREIFPGVYKQKNKVYTKNLIKNNPVYGERIIEVRGEEYREWNPYRSKLAAALLKGLKVFPLSSGDNVLYLGAGEGTTASHISDIVGEGGFIFCVDIAPNVFDKLIEVCERRRNMVPVLGDARKPEEYEDIVPEVDVIYQDVAQPDQVEILVRNAQKYLKPRGYAFLALKTRSIDVTLEPKQVVEKEKEKLKEYFDILDEVILDPYEKDHCLFVLRRK